MPAKRTLQSFIEDSTKVHNSKYTYGRASYTNNKTKVTITCPEHGDFEQIPNSHLLGNGCRRCANNDPTTAFNFLSRANHKHSNLYTYKVVPESSRDYITVVCAIHGDFVQKVERHLAGDGCPRCAVERSTAAKRLSTEEVVERIRSNSPTLWCFSKMEYTSAHTKITLICPEHGDKEVIPNDMFFGSGCSDCVSHGFNYKAPALLYYLKVTSPVDGRVLYKIGITNKSISSRYLMREQKLFEVLAESHFSTGAACKKTEQAILKMYAYLKYIGPPVLDTGNTELFTQDVLPGFRTKKG